MHQFDNFRYDQLVEQILQYVPDWDEKTLWGYACHCLFTGDRPLSEMGYGKPLDQIDRYFYDHRTKHFYT